MGADTRDDSHDVEGVAALQSGDQTALSGVRWRDLAAFAAALLAYAFTHGGLVYAQFMPAVQVGLIVGVVTAFAASSSVRAGVAALLGVGVGGAIEPLLFAQGSPLLLVATTALVAGLSAWVLRTVVDSGAVRKQLVVALGVVLILGNLWLTTATLGANQVVLDGQTMFQWITTRPTPGTKQPDQTYYLAIIDHMTDGMPYYQALRRAYHENTVWGYDPPNVFAVRQPLLLTALAALPGDRRSPIWALTFMASVAGLLAMALATNVSEASIRLLSLAAVAAYFLDFTTFPFVLSAEPWGGLLAVVCAGLFALSLRRRSSASRRWLVVAAALTAVLSVAVRELMLFLPVAGLVAAFFAERAERRFDLLAWSASLLASVAALGAHFAYARTIVTPRSGLEKWLGRGSLGNVVLGIVNGTRYLSASHVVLVGLALLGIAGLLLQESLQYRVFLALAVFPALLFFLVAWNGAIDSATSKPVNYWGSIVSPLLFALAPAALGPLLAGRLRPRATSERGMDLPR